MLRTRPVLSGFIAPCLPLSAEGPRTRAGVVHEIKHDGYRLMARRDPVGIRLLTRKGNDRSPRYPLIVEAVNRLKARSCLIDGEAVACDANGLAVFQHLRRKPSGRHVFLFAFDLLELDDEDLRREPFERRKATLASLLRRCLPGLRINEHLPYPGDVVFRHACKMGLEGRVRNPRRGWRARAIIGSAGNEKRRAACVWKPAAVDRVYHACARGCLGGPAHSRKSSAQGRGTQPLLFVSKRVGSRYRSGRSTDCLEMKNPDVPPPRQGRRGLG
jgi:hypothetical protein